MKTYTFDRNILPLLVACLLWVAFVVPASAQDTNATDKSKKLETIVVKSNKKPSATLSQAPVQIVDIEKMENSGALLLSDALKQMAGVTLRDYGGIGGMKTVSARGLGSQFSTLTIDGVAVNDCQNGQVDLGRYMIGNSSFISLSNGQPDDMLLSARATAAGSVINMQTSEPVFMPGEHTHTGISLETGSFGLLSTALSLQQRIGRKLSISAWGNWLKSNGDYPFTLYYTPSHDGDYSIERREHSSMWMVTGDMSLFYHISSNRSLSSKIHYVQGYHDLPGPVVFYATRGSEDTREKLFFAQAKYNSFIKQASFQLIGKYQHTEDLYEDFSAPTISRYLKNEYSQNEGYLSGTVVWKPYIKINASLASDLSLNNLHSNLKKNSNVERFSSLTTLALQYKTKRFSFKSNALFTFVNENACDNPSPTTYRRLSPYVGASVQPIASSNIRIRFFFKDIYRIPNFSELYYFVMPLDSLRPERASQYNVGITVPAQMRYNSDSTSWHVWSMTLDAYRNSIKDKIIAVPKQNMFLWSTMNLGIVDITGLDLKGTLDWNWQKVSLNATLTYSYQKAVDHTNPEVTKIYNNQIPYTPRHSGGMTLYLKTRWFNAGYNCMLVGKRYYRQQNNDDSLLPSYADHGISIDRSFELPIGDLRIQFQILNILDKQYEVVRSYPMMGRNFRLKASYSF